MIKAEELRMGNWVKGTSANTQVTAYMLLIYSESGKIFEPIPLTEDILIKAGFVKEKVSSIGGADMWSGMGAWSYNENKWLFRGHAKRLHLNGYFNTQIIYVHQLQNLYFALTGTELNI